MKFEMEIALPFLGSEITRPVGEFLQLACSDLAPPQAAEMLLGIIATDAGNGGTHSTAVNLTGGYILGCDPATRREVILELARNLAGKDSQAINTRRSTVYVGMWQAITLAAIASLPPRSQHPLLALRESQANLETIDALRNHQGWIGESSWKDAMGILLPSLCAPETENFAGWNNRYDLTHEMSQLLLWAVTRWAATGEGDCLSMRQSMLATAGSSKPGMRAWPPAALLTFTALQVGVAMRGTLA